MMYSISDLGVTVDGAKNEAEAREMAKEALEMAEEAGYDPSKPGKVFKCEIEEEDREELEA